MSEETTESAPPPEESSLLAERRAKLDRLREAGLEPFPTGYDGREPIADIRAAHEGLADGEETESRHIAAGRVMAKRGHGKAAFIDLRDGTGQIQLHSREDIVRIEIQLNNSAGIFQVDDLLATKIRGTPLEGKVEVVAEIEGETEKRLLSGFRLA